MTLKNKIAEIAKKAIANQKKQKETEETDRTKEGKKKAKYWAATIIEGLPERMEAEAQRGEESIEIKFNRGNEEGRWGMEFLQEWAEIQGFITNLNRKGDGLIIKWIWNENPPPFA